MREKKLDELISLHRQLVSETLLLKKEMIRIRAKLESQMYKTATKYNVVTNDLLVVKNKYRGSVKCYKTDVDSDGYIEWK